VHFLKRLAVPRAINSGTKNGKGNEKGNSQNWFQNWSTKLLSLWDLLVRKRERGKEDKKRQSLPFLRAKGCGVPRIG